MKYEIKVPEAVLFILRRLERSGYEAYMVGGCVRDSVMCRTPHDYDVCTSATPEQIIAAFPDRKIIPVGLQHGTVAIILKNKTYEVTTYRIDGQYSDNRRPDSVQYTNDLLEDLKRRDFTINAMAYNPGVGLVDPFHGIEDIANRRIRCVGSARERFEEDALRIMRAIRFSAQLGFSAVPDVTREIHQQCNSLKHISIERINSEFCKIACSHAFGNELVRYKDVFSLFIPELNAMFGFEQRNPYHAYDVFTHTIHAIENCESDDLITRLAIFFHDIGKPYSYQDEKDTRRHFKGHEKAGAQITDRIMKRMRFSNDIRNSVVELVFYHDSILQAEEKYVKRWLNKIGEAQFRRLLDIKKADLKGHKPDYDEEKIKKISEIETVLEDILSREACFSLKDLAVDGNDVMNIMHIRAGKEVGFWLNRILDKVINGELNNNRDDLVCWMTETANCEIDHKK